MDDAFIRCSRRLRLRHRVVGTARRRRKVPPGQSRQRGARPADRRRREGAAEAALPRTAGAALRAPMAADAAKFWYIRRRLRLTTPRSFAGTPAIAVRSKATACGITRAKTAAPFGVRRTTTSRLLVADRVRVTRPISTRGLPTREKVGTPTLWLAEASICRWPLLLATPGSTRHIAMLKWC